MKRATLAVRRYRHSSTHPYYLDLRAFKQGRKFFKTRAEAEAERMRQLTLRERGGREAIGLPLNELSTIVEARNKLALHGKTIADAAGHYLDFLERVKRCGVTISQLADEVVEAKRKDGRSIIYLRDLRSRLSVFCRQFGDRPVAAVTVEEIDDWLRNLDGSPKSRANFRANISVLFGYAADRNMIETNPVRRTSRPKLINKAPEIFTVSEVTALLTTAAANEPSVVPMIAIGFFAGLREAEIKRLGWKEIDQRRGFIEVTAAKAKTARRRIIRIQPNLAQWLSPYAAMTGAVVPTNARKKLEAIRGAAGLKHWSKNGLRHSFASYRLADTNDSATVAAELGHTGPQMLYTVYREVVDPHAAEQYWRIAPLVHENIIPLCEAANAAT